MLLGLLLACGEAPPADPIAETEVGVEPAPGSAETGAGAPGNPNGLRAGHRAGGGSEEARGQGEGGDEGGGDGLRLSTGDGRPLAVAVPEPADPSLGLTPYEVPLPAYLETLPAPADNPLTHAGVDLGRRLFYDPILSGSDTISCATCHHQERSFADRRGVSVGESGKPLARNTMALVNLAWTAPYFWDGRVETLEDLVSQPIEHPDEMAEDMAHLVSQLEGHPDYPGRFEAAFPGEGISQETLSKAIGQFLRTLVSFNSRADLIDSGRVELSELEMRGNQIMTGGLPMGAPDRVPDICDGCHKHSAGVKDEASEMGLFTISEARGNGLPVLDGDIGVGRFTGVAADEGRFIVPSIRNLSVTAPYMHDGRLADLDAVLLHYNEQMAASASLDEPLARDGVPLRMAMGPADRAAVVAMLGVFTDEHFLENPAFADPGRGGP